jgi:hypothetical protein
MFWGFFSKFVLQSLDRELAAADMGQIQYSEKYFDDTFEYRSVPKPYPPISPRLLGAPPTAKP